MRKIFSCLIWGNGKNLEKKILFWNMVFCVLTALQPAVTIMIVAWMSGDEKSGIVSIAFAISNLVYIGAAYGIRNFHATDTKMIFTFEEYGAVRLMTCSAAMVFSGIYLVYKNYQKEKMACIFYLCLMRIFEAVEDLCHGELQRNGRLDLAGKMGSVRLLVSFITLFCMLSRGMSFVASLRNMMMQSVFIVLLEYFLLKRNSHITYKKPSFLKCIQLFYKCFPLFLMNFSNIYICNAPKYAIDVYMSEGAQACFAVLFMPVPSVSLLSGILYNPKLVRLAELWNDENEKRAFWGAVRRQSFYILAIMVFVCIGGGALGLKILEVLYGLSLNAYKIDFLILLAGGGFNAFLNFFSACLTTVRRHFIMMSASAATALGAFCVSQRMVQYGGIRGASLLYLLLMTGEILAVMAGALKYLRRDMNDVKEDFKKWEEK